ncbi:hypothetical protein ESCO_001990 [Escovopsis weberi]|uniref:Microbial-type PARG catalytic domain-containing protein n=1 Tax=Escovopsis weberi TaxID=150374 RepID=A0A0M8N2E5_ESCWE|nr:hypothetical protein ESCO_001990 [Escovopsis weberi]
MPKQPKDHQKRLDEYLSSRPSIRPGNQDRDGEDSGPGPGPSKPKATRTLSKRQELIDRGRVDHPQRRSLLDVADETKRVLPGILDQIPGIMAGKSVAYFSDTLPALRAADCPRRTASGRARIRVVNDDTFNAAAALAAARPGGGRVAVLNMASDVVPGGGWEHGAMAQEEELCFRSSLYLSLHARYYPWARTQALYSPDVVVIRGDYASGHGLLVKSSSSSPSSSSTSPLAPKDLPVVGVLSVAALRTPAAKTVAVRRAGGGKDAAVKVVDEQRYADPKAREAAKNKMRLTLRMAAANGHGLLVLGALGCGAFRNPKHDVAHCWLEVLREAEFRGGWWEEVWFAVYDRRREGNFELFEELLGGEEV